MNRAANCTLQAGSLANPARRRILAGLGLVVATTLLLRVALEMRARAPRRDGIARIGQSLPHLPVARRNGQLLDLSAEGAGRKRVIVFFSPACRVCREELPHLEPFPVDLQLLMVDVGDSDSAEALKTPAGADAALYCDRGEAFRRSFPMLGVPLILFVDEQGVLRDGLAGPAGREALQHKLQSFAAAPEEIR
jgi:hypothetical protein